MTDGADGKINMNGLVVVQRETQKTTDRWPNGGGLNMDVTYEMVMVYSRPIGMTEAALVCDFPCEDVSST